MDINNYTPKYGGLTGRHFLSISDFSPEELYEILHTARLLKMKQAVGERQTSLLGKEVMLITKNAFSATRIALEIAVKQLCGTSIILPLGGNQLEALVEDVDFLPASARYGIDGIAVHTGAWQDAELLKNHSPVPIINAPGTTGPCVALAAILTIWEKFGRLKDVTVGVLGNMKEHNFFLQTAVKCGMKVRAIAPEEFLPDDEFIDSSAIYGTIQRFDNLEDGIKGCEVIFVSAGDNIGDDYKITEEVLEEASPNAIFLHPMPVNRATEADTTVADGEKSQMLNMAENLLHVEKAVLALTLGKSVNL
jgi:ornithine carbamoyltransferase